MLTTAIDFDSNMAPPVQKAMPLENGGVIILFHSGKCRVMGLKKPITKQMVLPYELKCIKLQSATLVTHIGHDINLIMLAKTLTSRTCMFEPELFPALRLLHFNPICVNVFSSGKIVILGVKTLNASANRKLVRNILATINRALLSEVDHYFTNGKLGESSSICEKSNVHL